MLRLYIQNEIQGTTGPPDGPGHDLASAASSPNLLRRQIVFVFRKKMPCIRMTSEINSDVGCQTLNVDEILECISKSGGSFK